MVDVQFIELHTDLFHAGKNFGRKLKPNTLTGLSVQWDPNEKWFEVTYNKRTGYILSSNVAFWEKASSAVPPEPKNEHKAETLEGRRRAQVATPMDHVFEGRGSGKTKQ